MTHEATTYRLLDGRGILIRHFGDVVRLTLSTPVRRPAAPAIIQASLMPPEGTDQPRAELRPEVTPR